jgi:hypothetical protein
MIDACPFKFDKCPELFVGVHNKACSVAALCFNDPDRSPLRINGCYPAPTLTGFAEIVSDDLPVLHPMLSVAPFRRQPG